MTKAIFKKCVRCGRERVIVAKGLCDSCYKNSITAKKLGRLNKLQRKFV